MEDASTMPNQDSAQIMAQPVASRQVLATDDVLEQWSSVHCPDASLVLQARQIASRMPTWIAPRSVHAGVRDVMATVPDTISPAAIEQLCDAITRRMNEDGLFGLMTPRRTGPLG